MPRIVAIIPAYNEDTRIHDVIITASNYADIVLVVDDGSSDQTAVVSEQAGATVIRHIENCGPGAATMTGFEAARILGADVVITLDADGQHDPHDIPSLLEPVFSDQADLAVANRFGQRNKIPVVRRFFNAIGNLITFCATGRWMRDSQCGFKVLGPKALAQVDIRMSGFEFCTELVRESVQHKWRVTEVPSKVLYSEYTMAKGQSFAMGIQTALKILLRSFLR